MAYSPINTSGVLYNLDAYGMDLSAYADGDRTTVITDAAGTGNAITADGGNANTDPTWAKASGSTGHYVEFKGNTGAFQNVLYLSNAVASHPLNFICKKQAFEMFFVFAVGKRGISMRFFGNGEHANDAPYFECGIDNSNTGQITWLHTNDAGTAIAFWQTTLVPTPGKFVILNIHGSTTTLGMSIDGGAEQTKDITSPAAATNDPVRKMRLGCNPLNGGNTNFCPMAFRHWIIWNTELSEANRALELAALQSYHGL